MIRYIVFWTVITTHVNGYGNTLELKWDYVRRHNVYTDIDSAYAFQRHMKRKAKPESCWNDPVEGKVCITDVWVQERPWCCPTDGPKEHWLHEVPNHSSYPLSFGPAIPTIIK